MSTEAKSQSVAHAARKNLASKIATSKVGKSLIKNEVGDEGNEIVSSLKAAISKFDRPSVAQQHHDAALKLLVKARLMVEKEQITKQDAEPLRKPYNELGALLLEVLDPSNTTPDVIELSHSLETTAGILKHLLFPYMTIKNQTLLSDTIAYVAETSFLETLILNPDYQDEKDQLWKNLTLLLLYEDDEFPAKVIRSNSAFSDKHSAIIDALQTFWRHIRVEEQQIGDMILTEFTKCYPQHEAALLEVTSRRSDNPGEVIGKILNRIISELNHFPRLGRKINDIGTGNLQLNVPLVAYEQLYLSTNSVFKANFEKDYLNITEKAFKVVYELIMDLINPCYGVPSRKTEEAKDDD